MAQPGFTPILLFASGTATNVPLAANLTSTATGAELALNYADGKLYYKDSGGVVQLLASKSAATVAGSTTQLIYNNAGSYAGSASLTTDGTNLTIGGTINANSITTNVSNGILGAGNASTMKNRIINGAMVIDQRNNGASISASTATYSLDRWNAYASQTSKYTVQQNANGVTPPSGFTNYLGVISSSAYSLAAGDIFVLQQKIEGFNIADLGWGTANAKIVTLSFQVYSSLTGTFGGSLQNGTPDRSYPFTYSIPVANTWTKIAITIAGDTTGTWATNNTTGICLNLNLGTGSTGSGTAGSWSGGNYYSATGSVSVVSTNGATFYITGVQLEVGSVATGFEYRLYNSELANCQRYCQAFASGNLSWCGSVYAGASNISFNSISLPVIMRVAPTLTGVSSWTIPGRTATAAGVSWSSTTYSQAVFCTSTNGLADGFAVVLSPNQAGILSSEL